MRCSVCGSDRAKIFTRQAEGKELRLTLCPDCYARLYPTEESDDFLTSFVGHTERKTRKECPSCGTTLDDFSRTGLLGCAHCYETFREELMPTVRYLQGKTVHVGKTPGGAAEADYDALSALVREQEYLRDAIREAEKEGESGRAAELRAALDAVNRKLYKGEE